MGREDEYKATRGLTLITTESRLDYQLAGEVAATVQYDPGSNTDTHITPPSVHSTHHFHTLTTTATHTTHKPQSQSQQHYRTSYTSYTITTAIQPPHTNAHARRYFHADTCNLPGSHVVQLSNAQAPEAFRYRPAGHRYCTPSTQYVPGVHMLCCVCRLSLTPPYV
jgi:hypothetical protein